MKYQYLGTAAAEGFPGLFCSCETCEKARRLGGRNIRTRSQSLINDDLLIDFSADTYLHVLRDSLDLRKIKTLLITHGHDDHLYTYDLQYRCHGYSYFPDEDKKEPLSIFSSSFTGIQVRKQIAKSFIDDPKVLKWQSLKAFEPTEVPGGYRVTALKGDHDIRLDPYIYIIEKDGKAILHAHDTGYFPDKTWEYLEKTDLRFDFVSLDCTCILEDEAVRNHMGLKTCSEVRGRLLKHNADENTVFYINHFSHNGQCVYDDLVPIAAKLGFNVSYDGCVIEL